MTYFPKNIRRHVFSLSGIGSGLIVLFIFTSKPVTRMSSYSMLCLGDSYTIGESVPPDENFPNQCVHLLRGSRYDFNEPELVAVTGWTTDELAKGIEARHLQNAYDFVTLLIGVNNQYQGRTVEQYGREFKSLLKRAIDFAHGKPQHVIVVSIPDWGATPFATDNDKNKIAKEIDAYNAANKKISQGYGVNYIDVTPGSRQAGDDPGSVAPDGLHPSAKEYGKWAGEIYRVITAQLQGLEE